MNKFLPMKIYVVLAILVTYSFSNKQHDILGQWYNNEKTAVVQIYQEQDKSLSGKIIWLKNPLNEQGKLKKDPHNPNKKLRDRARIGMVMMYGFIYQGNGVWEQGEVYDPKSGKTYGGAITLVDNNRLALRGHLLWLPLIGRTSEWTRKQ